MATTSQKMMEIKFFVRMRGALTPPPRIEEPVMKIPLDPSQPKSPENSRMECPTMLLRQLINLCTIQYPLLPMPTAIHLRGIVRPTSSVNSSPPSTCRHRTYVESFSIAGKEHIWSRSVVGNQRSTLLLQAPTTANADVAPPRP